jgi:hypothetical protein
MYKKLLVALSFGFVFSSYGQEIYKVNTKTITAEIPSNLWGLFSKTSTEVPMVVCMPKW